MSGTSVQQSSALPQSQAQQAQVKGTQQRVGEPSVRQGADRDINIDMKTIGERLVNSFLDRDRVIALFADNIEFCHGGEQRYGTNSLGRFSGKAEVARFFENCQGHVTDHSLVLKDLVIDPARGKAAMSVQCRGTCKKTGKSWDLKESWCVKANEQGLIEKLSIFTDTHALILAFQQ